MCGISGIVDFNRPTIPESLILEMQDCLKHRGPDGQGTFFSKNVGMAHNRLAIIDLVEESAQPMTREVESETVTISFNGEIYNYLAIRKELESTGHKFSTRGDTEVVLRCYLEYGELAWEKLDGFFALAIWDSRDKTLHIVRDPMGIKTVYYTSDADVMIFASEIKSLLRYPGLKKSVNTDALIDFFTHFYIPSPKTPLVSIKQVEPGQHVKFNQNGITKSNYWNLAVKTCSQCANNQDHFQHLRDELRVAVRSSLISDVPVALLLSAGIDSNIILSELMSESEDIVDTITIGFSNSNFDEAKKVRKIQKLQTFNNYQYFVADNEIESIFDDMVWHTDSLNANFAGLAEYFIFREAGKKFKVTLTGMGMDELFAGYSTYLADSLAIKYQRFTPSFIRHIAQRINPLIPNSGSRYPFSWLYQKFTAGSELPLEKRHFFWRSIFSGEELHKLLHNDSYIQNEYDPFREHLSHFRNLVGEASNLQRFQYADLRTFCFDNANVLMDGLSMAHGVEARPSLLSKRFVEFAFTVPDQLKRRRISGKYILREAYKDKLPNLVTKGKKVGLVSPVGILLRNELRELLVDSVNQISENSMLNKAFVMELLIEHLNEHKDHGYKLYLILVYLRWRKLLLGSI